MAKKTGILKVVGRKDFVVIHRINRISVEPYKELVSVLDFTSRGK